MSWVGWWWTGSLLANFCFIAIEYINRNATNGWPVLHHPLAFALIMLGQYGLYRAFNAPGSTWIFAWVVFFVGSSLTRVGAIHMGGAAHEITNWWLVSGGILGLGLASYVIKLGVK